MERRKQLIQLFFITVLMFAVVTACDKTDELVVDDETTGYVKDANGNEYKTVKIGSQVWTVENLKTTMYNDGTAIPCVTDGHDWANLTTAAYCNYENLESNADTYGRLYNWHAVSSGKLAPAGWHVSTDNDWTILQNYLIANGFNYDGTKVEDKVAKSLCAKTNWAISTNTGTPGALSESNNSSGFTAYPGGRRLDSGQFFYIGEIGSWWCYTKGSTDAFFRTLSFDKMVLGRNHGNNYRELGFSIRLVKD